MCERDSLSAFILCFAGMKAFLFLSSSFSSSSSLFEAGFEDEHEDEDEIVFLPALVSNQ